MSEKTLTQRFPFLLPLRRWQRKKFFYFQMKHDGNRYAGRLSEELLSNRVFETESLLLNENSGFDMSYQVNKVHNLKLAARTINGLVIEPGETFSFWKLVRWADRKEKYKDGLICVNGKIVGSYGGGLCQLSSMLFWLFLHTPLSIVERHGHAKESFPSTNEDLPCGTDATVHEGWLDLKVRNETDNTFQLAIRFDDRFMYGCILAKKPVNTSYRVFNPSVSYIRQKGKIYQLAPVWRSGGEAERELYVNRCEIAYSLPADIKIEEGEL